MSQEPDSLDIGEVIEASGIPASTLHLWEREGLIQSCGRNGLRRQYSSDVLARISIIVLSQRFGFSLSEIAGLFAPDAFESGKGVFEAKLVELRKRRAELDAAIDALEHGLACDAKTPLECPDFTSTLPSVLPVIRGRLEV